MATLAEYFLPNPKLLLEQQRELTLLALCVWGEVVRRIDRRIFYLIERG